MALLEVRNLGISFGGLRAVDSLDMSIEKGQLYGLIGPNGAGKTTVFNLLTGVYRPTEGIIRLDGENIVGKKTVEINKAGIARTFQNIRLFSDMTSIENVMVGTHTRTNANLLDVIFHTKKHKMTEKAAREKAEEVLKLTDLYDFKYHYATSLPYGYQRRLEIARAMASDPEVLMFDEPAAGMNEQETSDLMAFIKQLQGLGYTILLIEHDMRLVMNVCERIYVLDHGTLIAQGCPDEIKSNPQVIEAYLGKEA